MKSTSIIVALASVAGTTNQSLVTAVDVSTTTTGVVEESGSSGTIRAASSSSSSSANSNNTDKKTNNNLPPSFQQRTNIGIASYESSKRVERSKRHTTTAAGGSNTDMIRQSVLNLSSQQRGDSGRGGGSSTSAAMMKKKSSNNKEDSVVVDRDLAKGETKKKEEERELKKTKADKGDWSGSGGGGSWDKPSGGGWWGGHDDDDDDGYGGGWWEKPSSWDGSGSSHDGEWGSKPSWGWGSSKSGKSSGGWGDSGGGGWGDSKSGKSGGGWGGGSGKSGKDWGGSGKAGKGWEGGHGGGWGGGGGWCGDQAWVTVTNLSFQQSFSEIFAMTATYDVTDHKPIYKFGDYANEALQELAENADADEMKDRYDKRHGVEQVKVFSDFDFPKSKYDNKFLQGGSKATFKVRTSGYGHYLSIAVGLPFTNDGAVVLEGVPIYDGAEYYVPPIDAGTEANIQTCWSVAAKQDDFPPRSVCYKENNANDNYNDIGGEGFVSMHRGIQDLDSNNELLDILEFIECDELDIIEDDYQFAQYFWEVGFDDYILFCDNPIDAFFDWDKCDLYDDDEFLDNLDDLPDFYDKSLLIIIARESKDFDEFCDNIKDANKDLEDGFKTLEPFFFDWRNEIMKVEIDCGWHDDGWKDDAWDSHDDDWKSSGWSSGDSSSSSKDSYDWY